MSYPDHISSSRYMRIVAENWIADRWWVFALPLLPALWALISGETKYYIVAAALLCLALPLFLAALYLIYSLTPEAAANIRPHHTRRNPDGSITLLFRPDPETGRQYPPLDIKTSAIHLIEERGNLKVLHLKGKPFRYITIPAEI